MPYIHPEARTKYDRLLADLHELLICADAGELNYVFSSMIWDLWTGVPTYERGNELVGVLECVKQEFYRRLLSPHEDYAKERNGDLLPEPYGLTGEGVGNG